MTQVLAAEMVASVHSVYVRTGDLVEPQTMVVLLESMKMEIPVFAEVSGVVSDIDVAPGDSLQEGDRIAVIEETGRD